MSSIDEVIRRSREVGKFSERKEFSIAKARAIQKLRKFALKTPSHYILELIQAAVANRATYLNIDVDLDTTRIAWTGGGFALKELQQIFDYIFSDHQETENAAIQQLAIGINALLVFEPQRIIIESGQGTIATSTRIEIDPTSMQITSGRPDEPLNGTYILAEDKNGMKGREVELISERCLALFIPIIVNDVFLAGYSSIRSPRLLGVKKSVQFDEGDFYGSIALSLGENTGNFLVLTHGVWIQTVKHELGLPQTFGGIIGFDSLNKTVDRASIVEDEKWREMWARVSLIARELVSTEKPEEIRMIVNGKSTPFEICKQMAVKAGGAILFLKTDNFEKTLIPRYEKIYGFPGFVVVENDFDLVRGLLGIKNVIIANGTHDELDLLEKPKVTKVKGPFFADPLSLGEIYIGSYFRCKNITIYTPRLQALTIVEFISRDRLDQSIEVPNYPAGFLLRIDLFDGDTIPADASTLTSILDHCSEMSRTLSIKIANDFVAVTKPNTTIAFHILRAIASSTVFSVDGGQFSIRRLGIETNDILHAKILTTLDNEPKSILEIVDLMNRQYGLVYGSVTGSQVDLRNLDQSRILSLTVQQENEIISIFGEAAYVRIDDRDILATHTDNDGNTFTIRDIAIGLGAYDSHYICCEDNDKLTTKIAGILIGKLKVAVLDLGNNRERRRQSLRHLIWTLTHEAVPHKIFHQLEKFPLFRTIENEVVSLHQLGTDIDMIDGWPVGPIALPTLQKCLTHKTDTLFLNPFVFHMLSREIRVDAQSNKIGDRADLRKGILSSWFEDNRMTGHITLMSRNNNKSFSVINLVSKKVHTTEVMATRLMCAGEIFIDDPEAIYRADDNTLFDLFLVHAIKLFGKAADLINKSEKLVELQKVSESALFGSMSLVLARRVGDFHHVSSRFPEVERLLHCKIFPTKKGIPMSAIAMARSFEDPVQQLHEEAPSYQKEWFEIILDPQHSIRRVVQPNPKPVNWKKKLFPDSDGVSRSFWASMFVNTLAPTIKVMLVRRASAADLPLLQTRQFATAVPEMRLMLNNKKMKNYGNDRVWLAMSLLAHLYEEEIIDFSKLLDTQKQIADLVLKRGET